MADIPWWGNSLITAVVTVLVTVYALKRGASAAPSTGLPTGAGSLAIETITYIPHILLLFGVLADMFTMQGVYSIPSLVGVFSIPLNYVMQYFWSGLVEVFGYLSELGALTPGTKTMGAPAATAATAATAAAAATAPTGFWPSWASKAKGGAITQYSGCNVQGFEKLQSSYAPQTLVVTATVFAYYIIDIIMNRGIMNAVATLVVFGVLFAGQTFFIGDTPTGCKLPGGSTISKFTQAFLALAEGFLFGGVSYSVMQAYYPSKLPSAVIPKYPVRTAKDLKPGPNGTLVDAAGVAWKLLPDGSTLLDTCAPSNVGKIAEQTGASTGTSCPTSAPVGESSST